MKPVQPEDRIIQNIHTADFQPFDPDDQGSSRESVLQLGDKQRLGVGFHVYKMAPDTWTTPHEHTDHEEFLLLSGDLRDNDGTEYQIGDLVWMRKGTQHSSYSEKGCVLAVYIATPEKEV
ncbi:MAG: cupin domain-containing protein [Gammaproteobacteria bacterium]|nr:cupin domain-containing protein [Gammaproteobacteria bacterium]